MDFNFDLSFSDFVKKIKKKKREYRIILASFRDDELKLKNKELKIIKDKIYSLKYEEWKKDKIWEFFNDDIEFSLLKKIK